MASSLGRPPDGRRICSCGHMVVGIWNMPVNSSHYLPDSAFELLAAEVLRQCDPQDGVVDNIIQDPLGCQFRPETLLCASNTNNNTSACLTAEQIKTVNKLHRDWVEANSTFIFPHFLLGSEWGWGGTGGLVSSPSPLGTEYVKYMLGLGPDWQWQQDWTPELIFLSDQINPGNATADDFDLEPSYRAGGKVIHYHGMSDASIATGSSIYFYERVVEALQPRGIDLDEFYRFFLIPGMG